MTLARVKHIAVCDMSFSCTAFRAVTVYTRKVSPSQAARRHLSVDMSESSFAPKRLSGCIFDMDGTITQPHAIDFKAMRARAGVPPGMDIIEYIDSLPDHHDHQPQTQVHHAAAAHAAGHEQPSHASTVQGETAQGHAAGASAGSTLPGHAVLTPRQAAMWAVEDEEHRGLQRMQLMPDAHTVLEHLRALGIPRALLTRNNAAAMEQTVTLFQLRHGWERGLKGRPFDIMLSREYRPCKPHPAPIHHIAERWGVHPSSLVMVGDHADDMQCGRAAGATTVLIGDDVGAVPWADHVVGSLTELKELLSRLYGLPAVPTAL